jgi:hypothetical protein
VNSRVNVWVGRVDVRPQPGVDIFGGDPGAITNAVAIASKREEFEALTEQFFASMGLTVVGYSDVEPLSSRQLSFQVPAAMLDLAAKARANGGVQFDTFYVYLSDEDAPDTS